MTWDKLVGMTLPNEWTVTSLLPRQRGDSGGAFSVQFEVSRNGQVAFMKAFDLAKLIRETGSNLPRMQQELESINFEQALLELCLGAKTKSVALPLEISKVSVPGVNADNEIQYIIFEKGGPDLRRYHNYRNEIDHIANLLILRNVAIGLSELHALEIAHQDLKPSNVVIFTQELSKIVDLGRASHRPRPVWHDANNFAGDRSYAPIEIIYKERNPDWFIRRMAGDLYMLGSLAAFLFTGVNLTAQIFTMVQPQFHPSRWTDSYSQVSPYLRVGLRNALAAHKCFATGNGARLASLIRELCDPDPLKRGCPSVGMTPARYSMRRYISILERMIKEVRIKGLAA